WQATTVQLVPAPGDVREPAVPRTGRAGLRRPADRPADADVLLEFHRLHRLLGRREGGRALELPQGPHGPVDAGRARVHTGVHDRYGGTDHGLRDPVGRRTEQEVLRPELRPVGVLLPGDPEYRDPRSGLGLT